MQKVGFFRSIHFKIALVYVLLLLVAMQLIGVYFIDRLEKQFLDNFKQSIEQRANYLKYNAAEQIEEASSGSDEDLKAGIGKVLEGASNKSDFEEVQIISADNQIVLGSSTQQENVGKRTTSTVVKRVLLKQKKLTNRFRDPKTNGQIYVLAEPIKLGEHRSGAANPGGATADEEESKGDILGVLYIKASMKSLYDQMGQINQILVAGTVISLAVTAILGVILSRTITLPVSDMRKHALQIARGDFSRKVKVYGHDEIGQLATAFNQMTARLKNANDTTEAERKKLRSVLSNMTDGVIATDRNGNVILMNNRAEELLNIYRQNVFGMPVLALLKLEERLTWDEMAETVHSVLIDLSSQEESQMVRASFSPVQNENEPAGGVIVVLHDVTEQEEIEAERREFVSNVSHELRTPLTTMKSYLEALGDGALQDENLGPKFLQTAQNETDRMTRLVTDLLKLSKMDSKSDPHQFSRVDFVEFFHQIIDRFEMTKKENIHFIRKLPSGKLYVRIDRDKLTQVMDNIISNALKYSPNGGTVVFRMQALQHHLYVTITDEGVGIPKSQVPKIFDRFYRVDKARSRKLGGTGLGLAIAKEMIHAHGGEIWAESEWNEGTSIHFTLPRAGKKGARNDELGEI